jgi:DNA-binding MarR family transcriptional regulator
MTTVNDVKPTALTGTLTFQLGVLGSVLADRFAERILTLGLKTKHAGLLAALAASGGLSQQELAVRMRVAPSLVVALADHLEGMAALTRTRDAVDRRRQLLALTETGRELLAGCGRAAAEIEAELVAGVPERQVAGLRSALGRLLEAEHLPH